MHRLVLALCFILAPPLAHAWNAAGHRLAAFIAWQQLSPPNQEFVAAALARHPDYPRWLEKARPGEAVDIFVEASTWPDNIRRDPRFYNDEQEPATPPIPGLADMARHKRWHYVDLDDDGKVRKGEIDRQIERLSRVLSAGARSTAKKEQISYALPWLLHLVADIHQPLHVGRHDDQGGNAVEIENPFNKRQPFSTLHSYWDDLPGPPWLRGKRLEQNAARLLATIPPPSQGNVRLWRDESRRLHTEAYPKTAGSLLPIISEDFHQQARAIANRRIVEAGYRLGRLLETTIPGGVSRETP
jgi:hypothetical protein